MTFLGWAVTTSRSSVAHASLRASVSHAIQFCLQAQTELMSPVHLFHRGGEEDVAEDFAELFPYFVGAVDENLVAARRARRSFAGSCATLSGALIASMPSWRQTRRATAVSDLGLRRPTLDDVFLQLTGAPPSENGAGAEVATGDGRPNPKSLSVHAARAGSALRPAATRPSRWRRLSPRELRADITDARVVSVRNLRHFVRQPDLLVFSTIQPIMFVLLFTYVFGGAINHSLPPGVSYIDYLLPGILVQSVTFRASMTAVGLSDDLKLGVIDRFRSMPMARSAVLIGRTAADLVRNVLIIVLMIIVGYISGFRFQAGVAQALACMALVSAFGLALSCSPTPATIRKPRSRSSPPTTCPGRR
jgi:ABC-type transport system involved in cytochrome c biogenesis permease component